MKKSIIFLAVVALTAILATVEIATIGVPEVNYFVLTVCGVCLCAGLIYMRLSMYKLREILWCLAGGIALTMLVIFGAHFADLMPVAIDYFHLGALGSLILAILTSLYMIAVYAASLYFFVFYFCEMREKIRDFE
ncbi:MAG: hypothetical protein IJ677_06120 [Alphaproteobacteria bacterium]|nr:hypothetical protein [Alphaproteobacteria bacterium]